MGKTFLDLIKRLEWFQMLGVKHLQPAVVLYGSDQSLKFPGGHVLNPLDIEDIWLTLTAPSE